MGIDTSQIVKLRQRTGVGFADCQRALEHCGGDLERAIIYLREQGALKATKKTAERTADEGIVATYVHADGRLGAMVEVNCETDFVARNPEFQQFAHDLAMQVAAANPQYVRSTDVPAEVVAREREIYLAQLKGSGKPPAIAEKIVAGKLDQFYREQCLLQQPFIKDDQITIQQLVEEQVVKLGEKVAVKRFVRFQV